MGMDTQKSLKVAIALNALIVALEVGSLVLGMSHRGISAFMFYTMLSNLLGGIACATYLYYELRELRRGAEVPHSVRMLKYSAACCLLVTFSLAAFVLAPMYVTTGKNGFYLMFCRRELPITHLLAPALVCGSYALFEADRTMTFRQSLVGFAPTFLYVVIAYLCNITHVWNGPYEFFMVWNMPVWQSIVWFVGLCTLAICLCSALRLLARRVG